MPVKRVFSQSVGKALVPSLRSFVAVGLIAMSAAWVAGCTDNSGNGHFVAPQIDAAADGAGGAADAAGDDGGGGTGGDSGGGAGGSGGAAGPGGSGGSGGGAGSGGTGGAGGTTDDGGATD